MHKTILLKNMQLSENMGDNLFLLEFIEYSYFICKVLNAVEELK